MRPLAWLLVRWPYTVSLAGLTLRLEEELDARALATASGRRSPNQLPPIPPDFWEILIGLIAVAVFFAIRTHLNIHIHR